MTQEEAKRVSKLRVKRGYLASGILAIVMVAGYLGLLPLLQSLAAEPAWPQAPTASSAAPVSQPVTMAPIQTNLFADSSSGPRTTSKPHHRSHRVSRPATVPKPGSAPTTTAKPATRPP